MPLFGVGELIFSHLRRGSAYTASKVTWFLSQTLKRLPPQGEKQLRTDSGFYSRGVVGFCEAHEITFAITADQMAPLMELLNVAGKIVHTARQYFLILSDQYHYQEVWQFALKQLDALKFA